MATEAINRETAETLAPDERRADCPHLPTSAPSAPAAPPALAIFPVTHSILCGETLLSELARAYAIGMPATCRLLMPGVNDTYLLTTRDDRYIVRVYRAAWRSTSEIAYELDLLAHLAARQVPVSVPITDRSGALMRPLEAPEGTRQVVVFTYAPGGAMWWNNDHHCYLAGRLAALIHAASDDFSSRHSRFRLDLEYLVDFPLAAVRPFLARRAGDLRYLENLAAVLREHATAAVSSGLDWGVCHGDFHSENIHVADGHPPTIFDFDFCAPGWRAYDLFEAQRRAVSKKNPGIWASFLKGYTEIRRFSDRDVAAVRIFRAIRYLWSIGQSAQKVARWGLCRMDDEYLDRKIGSLRQWEAEQIEDH